jgi:hypothetical protein
MVGVRCCGVGGVSRGVTFGRGARLQERVSLRRGLCRTLCRKALQKPAQKLFAKGFAERLAEALQKGPLTGARGREMSVGHEAAVQMTPEHPTILLPSKSK